MREADERRYCETLEREEEDRYLRALLDRQVREAEERAAERLAVMEEAERPGRAVTHPIF